MGTKNASHFETLKGKWESRHKILQEKVHTRHKSSFDWLYNSSKQIMASSLGGLLMMVHPVTPAIVAQGLHPNIPEVVETSGQRQDNLMKELKNVLPSSVDILSVAQESEISKILSQYFSMTVTPFIGTKRLNRTYGIIGAEQHLRRFPGDTMGTHFDKPDDVRYTSSGMAPNKGAWGYFANSRVEATETDILREKYYIAVQSFLAPGYNDRLHDYRDFLKFRKMLIVNPENGKAVVAVIGDAGPAVWTGKHLGGSPEVMDYLERQDGRSKGPVLYFFIDDEHDTIPLGPIRPT